MLIIEPLWSSIDGRLLVARVSHTSGLYNPINIYVLYAPASVRERNDSFHSFSSLMPFDQSPPSRSILLGDFNHNIHARQSNPSIRNWIHWIHSFWFDPAYNDLDNRNLPTFRNISTIDFLLVTDDMSNLISKPELRYVPRCDHSAISLRFSFGDVRSGPGLWHCHPHLVQDPLFRSELTALCENAEQYMPDIDTPLKWDFFKCRLKSFIQAYSNKAAAKRRRNQKHLQRVRNRILRQPVDEINTEKLSSIES